MIYYFAREKTHEVVVCFQWDLWFGWKRPPLFYFIIYFNEL